MNLKQKIETHDFSFGDFLEVTMTFFELTIAISKYNSNF